MGISMSGAAGQFARGSASIHALRRPFVWWPESSSSARPRPSSTPTARFRLSVPVTGEHQIADACEPGQGFATASQGANQPRDFREAPSEQSGDGICAETEPIANARGDSDHVLQRPGQARRRLHRHWYTDETLVPRILLAARWQARRRSRQLRPPSGRLERLRARRKGRRAPRCASGCAARVRPCMAENTSVIRSNVPCSMPLVVLTKTASGCQRPAASQRRHREHGQRAQRQARCRFAPHGAA